MTLDQFCKAFGCTREQAEILRAKNKAQLEAMYDKAWKSGKRVNGYTSEQLRQLINGLEIPRGSKTFKIKIAFKFFLSTAGFNFASCIAKYEMGRVKLSDIKIEEKNLLMATEGGSVHDAVLRDLQKNVSNQVHSFVSDPDGFKNPIRWNRDTGLECEFEALKEVA